MTSRGPASQPASPLDPRDSAAVDALAESAFAPSSETPAARLVALLGVAPGDGPAFLSSSDDADRRAASTLVDVTMARILRDRAGRRAGAVAGALGDVAVGPALSVADDHAIEELVESGWSAARVSSDPRAERAAALLALLSHDPASSSDSLAVSTLDRIQRAIDGSDRRLRLEPAAERANTRRGLSFRLADLGAIAAVIAVSAAVLWPLAAGFRERTRELASGGAGLAAAPQYPRSSLAPTQAALLGGVSDQPSRQAAPRRQATPRPGQLHIFNDGRTMFLFRPFMPAGGSRITAPPAPAPSTPFATPDAASDPLGEPAASGR